jgi:UDP-2,4-diacetamido-2,4,6-trideoxy-beta-L-altropyranose hydrolase
VPKVLCRVDGGGVRGLGHLQRCLSLSQALAQQDVSVIFLAPAIEELRRRVDDAGCRFVPMSVTADEAGGPADWMSAVATAGDLGCEIVLVDSYDADDRYLAAVRAAGFVVVALDDLGREAFSAQLVVNGAAGAETRAYRSVTGDTTFLLGPQYALLGQAFWHAEQREVAATVRRILVAVGGGYPHGALPRVLDVLDSLAAPFDIVAVEGPFAPVHNGAPARYEHGVEFVRAPADLHDLMIGADVAVSAAGQTLYELAATGTPTIAVQVFENQHANLRHLAAAGAVRDAGCMTDADFEARLAVAVSEVIADHRERIEMSAAGRRLVDGRGALRVAQAMTELA